MAQGKGHVYASSKETMDKDYPVIWVWLHVLYDTITLDVQHNFHFGLDLFADSSQGHKKTLVLCISFVWRVVLCVLDIAQHIVGHV